MKKNKTTHNQKLELNANLWEMEDDEEALYHIESIASVRMVLYGFI